MHLRLIKILSFKSASIFALVFAATLLSGCKFNFGIGYNKGYSPEQPIPFDHSLHVGQNKIQCQYCHNQVERSAHSNIPTLQTCMNCHLQVATDKPNIQALRELYDAGKSVEWVRVHMLPDYVHFNHNAHIAKGVNCSECHGPIETMQQVYQHSDLSMGWCIECHRKPENNAPLNCSTCHY